MIKLRHAYLRVSLYLRYSTQNANNSNRRIKIFDLSNFRFSKYPRFYPSNALFSCNRAVIHPRNKRGIDQVWQWWFSPIVLCSPSHRRCNNTPYYLKLYLMYKQETSSWNFTIHPPIRTVFPLTLHFAILKIRF